MCGWDFGCFASWGELLLKAQKEQGRRAGPDRLGEERRWREWGLRRAAVQFEFVTTCLHHLFKQINHL